MSRRKHGTSICQGWMLSEFWDQLPRPLGKYPLDLQIMRNKGMEKDMLSRVPLRLEA